MYRLFDQQQQQQKMGHRRQRFGSPIQTQQQEPSEPVVKTQTQLASEQQTARVNRDCRNPRFMAQYTLFDSQPPEKLEQQAQVRSFAAPREYYGNTSPRTTSGFSWPEVDGMSRTLSYPASMSTGSDRTTIARFARRPMTFTEFYGPGDPAAEAHRKFEATYTSRLESNDPLINPRERFRPTTHDEASSLFGQNIGAAGETGRSWGTLSDGRTRHSSFATRVVAGGAESLGPVGAAGRSGISASRKTAHLMRDPVLAMSTYPARVTSAAGGGAGSGRASAVPPHPNVTLPSHRTSVDAIIPRVVPQRASGANLAYNPDLNHVGSRERVAPQYPIGGERAAVTGSARSLFGGVHAADANMGSHNTMRVRDASDDLTNTTRSHGAGGVYGGVYTSGDSAQTVLRTRTVDPTEHRHAIAGHGGSLYGGIHAAGSLNRSVMHSRTVDPTESRRSVGGPAGSLSMGVHGVEYHGMGSSKTPAILARNNNGGMRLGSNSVAAVGDMKENTTGSNQSGFEYLNVRDADLDVRAVRNELYGTQLRDRKRSVVLF